MLEHEVHHSEIRSGESQRRVVLVLYTEKAFCRENLLLIECKKKSNPFAVRNQPTLRRVTLHYLFQYTDR